MEPFENEQYKKAQKKVKELKGFYSHLTVYIVINLVLLGLQLLVFQNGTLGFEVPRWSMFTTPFFWGIGLTFHGLYVFQDRFRFFKNWEERKIREYMEKDEEEMNKTNTWD
ncbi:MAG: 2TM domain-containing protein [Altibacter sp.]|nr:2TM domain-containing protein [Altibacter sp.]